MTDDVRELLDACSPEVRELGIALRLRLHELAPEAHETVMMGYKSIGYGFDGGMRGMFVAISLHKQHANLQFYRGAELPDPAGLLEGIGKSMRHFKIRTLDDIDQDGLAGLVEAAAALARS